MNNTIIFTYKNCPLPFREFDCVTILFSVTREFDCVLILLCNLLAPSHPTSHCSILPLSPTTTHSLPSSPTSSPLTQCVEIVTACICHYLSDPKSRSVYASKEIASIIVGVISSNPPVRERETETTQLLVFLFC